MSARGTLTGILKSVLRSFKGVLLPTGTTFYVDSATGSDTPNSGRKEETPVATIDYAIGLCTASKSDVIYVMPGHSETISAAAGIVCDVIGISIIGLGSGGLQPSVELDTEIGVDVDIDAASVTIENIHFKSGFADITAGIDVNAADFTLRNCRFTESADNENFLICVLGAAANASPRLTVEGCYCLQDDASNTHFVSLPGTSDSCIIRNNTIMGDFGTAAIGAAGIVTYIVVTGNHINNLAAVNDTCININTSATGMIHANMMGSPQTQANHVLATGCSLNENYAAVTSEDNSGIPDPGTT